VFFEAGNSGLAERIMSFGDAAYYKGNATFQRDTDSRAKRNLTVTF
jgi:hypothetical protein